MANVPAILICADAKHTDCNRTFDAIGRGPNTFSVALVAASDDSATYQSPATHWLGQDMSATDELTSIWLAMTNGEMPAITGSWGEDGIISEVDAVAACTSGNLQVYSAGGLIDSAAAMAWRNAVLEGAGLKLRPDEPW